MLAALAGAVGAITLTRWGPDAADPDRLAEIARRCLAAVEVVPDLDTALAHSLAAAGSGLLITGSHRLAGAVRARHGYAAATRSADVRN